MGTGGGGVVDGGGVALLINTYATEVVVFSSDLSSSRHSHVGSLFNNEEQERVGKEPSGLSKLSNMRFSDSRLDVRNKIGRMAEDYIITCI